MLPMMSHLQNRRGRKVTDPETRQMTSIIEGPPGHPHPGRKTNKGMYQRRRLVMPGFKHVSDTAPQPHQHVLHLGAKKMIWLWGCTKTHLSLRLVI